eukprot:CCRYP_015879-RA/>CCRYP_015879-RA protein AED:0.06 eAED:0.06 QI:1674/1/0.6/1/0.25/0/5/138/139
MPINNKAILSGALGASASLIAKLALSPDSPVPSSVNSICRNLFESVEFALCPALALVSRLICLLLMIGLNAVMISSFLDGMNASGSVVGTALSTAANFSCSALYGAIFFQEYVSMAWYFGATLIGIGMWLLSSIELIGS